MIAMTMIAPKMSGQREGEEEAYHVFESHVEDAAHQRSEEDRGAAQDHQQEGDVAGGPWRSCWESTE